MNLNHDHKIDFILITQYYFGILFGNSNGTFQVENMSSIPTNGVPEKFVIVDLDNDQHLDIVSANTEDNLEIIYGNRDGTFLSSIL